MHTLDYVTIRAINNPSLVAYTAQKFGLADWKRYKNRGLGDCLKLIIQPDYDPRILEFTEFSLEFMGQTFSPVEAKIYDCSFEPLY